MWLETVDLAAFFPKNSAVQASLIEFLWQFLAATKQLVYVSLSVCMYVRMYVCPYVCSQKIWKFLKIVLGWMGGPGGVRGRSGDTLW